MFIRTFYGFLISRVGVSVNAGRWIIPKHPAQPHGCGFCSIRHDNYAGMLGVTHADTTAMVNGNPGRAARSIEESIQQRPVGDRITSIQHCFGLTIRTCDGTAVKVD